jgi:hypothetical protein
MLAGTELAYARVMEASHERVERVPTHLISDDGTRYAPGEIVRVDQSSGRIQIVADPEGDYEVMNCRQATEYAGDTPLLRVDLKKRVAAPVDTADPWAPRRPNGW